MISSYKSLGIRPVINANATLTKLGGSLMPAEVSQAINSAAKSFVDMHDLQQKVGERLAEITKNEAAFVSCGAATGLLLATAACIKRLSREAYENFPNPRETQNEVIVQHMHRNPYDYAVRQAGASLVEIGTIEGTSLEDLENAYSFSTVAIFWFQGVMNQPYELSLEEVIQSAKKRGVPVIVDGAAQLPPVSSLWNFTQQGADLAIFSGGKDLSGPQASGLVVGKSEWIERIRVLGAPNHGVGRPMKVGKEEMMGLLAAVERYVSLDHDRLLDIYEQRVQLWVSGLNGKSGLSARRDYPNEAGQPVPRALIELPGNLSKEKLVDQLMDSEPAVSVAPSEEINAILLNPMTVSDAETQIVLNQILRVMG
jgi:L-seryl-tRNA(Ser) seleniumtransferase